MKSERRHELQENVLAHELTTLKQFLAKYGNWVLTGVCVVLIIILIIWWSDVRTRDRVAAELADFERLKTESNLLDKERTPQLINLINTAKSPEVVAGSAVLLGEMLTQQYAQAMMDPQGQKAAGDLKNTALQYYQLVIDRYATQKPFVARAYLGMGKLAENEGDFAKARQNYEQVAQVVNAAYPSAIEAQRRLSHLGGSLTTTASSQPAEFVESWTTPVRFATTVPASQPASSPASRPATSKVK